MKLSIIIPVYNEEETIVKILRRVVSVELPAGWDKEIFVVDDGSTDGTLEKVKSQKSSFGRLKMMLSEAEASKVKSKEIKLKIFQNKRNQGKGAAVRKGIERATGEVLIIQDADLEYDPKDYQRLLTLIISGKAEVVYGSRLKKMKLKFFGKDKTPFPLHYLVNRFLSFLTNILYGSDLTDMETCYKMMKKNVYENLNLESSRFEVEPEITAKILKKGYKIVEVPIVTEPRGYKEGKKIKAVDAFKAIYTLFKFRL